MIGRGQMQIRLLGPVEISVAGCRVEVGPPQRRAVLAALAVDAGKPVPADALIDRVWGETAPTRVRSAVHSNITLIRRLLAEVNAEVHATVPGEPAVNLIRQGGGYLLQVDTQRVDLHRFHSLTADARDGRRPDPERAELLRRALELWHGPALADLSGDWPARMRTSWGQQRLDTAVDWARTELQLGRHEQVISPVRALVADYPYVEPLTAVLMRALRATGRVAEALDCYATTRARLAEELGTDPGTELRDLHQAILRGEPERGEPESAPVRRWAQPTGAEPTGAEPANAQPANAQPADRHRQDAEPPATAPFSPAQQVAEASLPSTTLRGRRTGRLILAGLTALAVAAAFAVAWQTSRQDGRRAASSTAVTISDTAGQTPTPSRNLIAVDDFTSAPNTVKWNIYHSQRPNGAFWSRTMVRVDNGELQIVGTGRNPTGQGNVSGGLCWCGAGGNHTYGKWQVRARFDAGSGYGQTIGLWPQSDNQRGAFITFAAAREADKKTIRGYVVSNADGRVSDGTRHGNFTAWHTYIVDWRETYVKMYVDDTILYDSTVSKSPVTIPRTPMHLAVQQIPGPHDGIPAPDASTPDQVIMHVGWVRIYD